MKKTWWQSNEWNALCDECGFKFKAQQLKRRWDGLMVCSDCWEIRHPQEMIRPIPDQTKLPWTRPDSARATPSTQLGIQEPVINSSDQFVPAVCTPWGLQGLADYGSANCAAVGRDLGYRNTIDTTHNA